MDASDVKVTTTEFAVTAYPNDTRGQLDFTITVKLKGRSGWSICDGSSVWNKATQVWDYEGLPSGLEDDWFRDHRYPDAPSALYAAKQIAPQMTVNGWTIQQAVRIEAGEEICGRPVERGVRCSLTPGHEGDHAQ